MTWGLWSKWCSLLPFPPVCPIWRLLTPWRMTLSSGQTVRSNQPVLPIVEHLYTQRILKEQHNIKLKFTFSFFLLGFDEVQYDWMKMFLSRKYLKERKRTTIHFDCPMRYKKNRRMSIWDLGNTLQYTLA